MLIFYYNLPKVHRLGVTPLTLTARLRQPAKRKKKPTKQSPSGDVSTQQHKLQGFTHQKHDLIFKTCSTHPLRQRCLVSNQLYRLLMVYSKRKHLHVLLSECQHLLAPEQNSPLLCKIKCWSHRDELCSHFNRRASGTGQFSGRVRISDGKYSPVRLSPDTAHVLPVGIQPPQGLQAQPKSTHVYWRDLGLPRQAVRIKQD